MEDLIRVLPDNIANQIAAGEVIQRPGSVVKELLENAIDAGATQIDVNVKDAGKTLIQVVDNGCGMSPSDARLCFVRHATSKVRTADDLFKLTTKGFRGEALASVAAIAHVEMHTRPGTSEVGQNVIVEGNEIISQEEIVCPTGTSFEVKNLFYNVPARRNFLKKDSTEFGHIQEEFERIALSHPDLHLTLAHNGQQVYNLVPAILRKRIVQILGGNMNDKLVPIDESTDIVTVRGFVLKPEHARKTRGDQYLFVNNRYFRSTYFSHAVSKAFEGLIREGSFPGYFLYLDVDTDKIDVNVHPTKTEIKFEEEKFIYSILLSSIRQALGKYNIAPTLEFDQETSFDIPHAMRSQPAHEPVIRVNPDYNPFRTTSQGGQGSGKSGNEYSRAITSHGFGQEKATQADWENFYSIEEESVSPDPVQLDLEEVAHQVKHFLVKGNFVLCPSKSGFMVIHARRAMERIIYTEIFNAFISNPIDSQRLLFPIEKEISRQEVTLWNSNTSILSQLGFDGKAENNLLTVDAVPALLQDESISGAIEHLLETVAHKDIDKGDLAHSLILSIARAAASGRIHLENQESIQSLVDRLFQCEEHAYSPSHKKIIDTISLEEIHHKFD